MKMGTEWGDWKKSKSKTLNIKEFKTAKDLLRTIIQTKEYFGLILHGTGGLGKTVSTLAEIKEVLKAEDWDYLNGYSTPLSLYKSMYFAKDKKIIILDDCAGLFKNETALNLMKGATEEVSGKRIVQYHSTSSLLDVPQQFMINAKIILLCNKIPKPNDISVKAFLSRCISFEVAYSYDQIIKVCKQFVKENKTLTPAQRTQVIKVLVDETSKATKDLSFRNLKQLIAFVKYDPKKAKGLFKAVTVEDENLSAYFKSIKAHPRVVKDAIKMFGDLCGKTKMTFHRIKKQQKKVNRK